MEDKVQKAGFGQSTFISADGTHLGGAILEIRAGKSTDMIFHRLHGKIVYVLGGKILVRVVSDGKLSGLEVPAGQSFFVRPGLVHQMTGIQHSIVVEFSEADAYKKENFGCIYKGTSLETTDVEPGEFAKMSEGDKEKVEEPNKTVRKKRQTKKKKPTAKKKTPRKRTKKPSAKGK